VEGNENYYVLRYYVKGLQEIRNGRLWRWSVFLIGLYKGDLRHLERGGGTGTRT
jgi:hypothetical protein